MIVSGDLELVILIDVIFLFGGGLGKIEVLNFFNLEVVEFGVIFLFVCLFGVLGRFNIFVFFEMFFEGILICWEIFMLGVFKKIRMFIFKLDF